MSIERKKSTINLYFVSRLLGPLALMVENDYGEELCELIDYSKPEHCELVIKSLILPLFIRLDEKTTLEVKKSLGYLINNSGNSVDFIEDKLLLCGIPPDNFYMFMEKLWSILFPDEISFVYNKNSFKLKNKPLTMDQFNFSVKSEKTIGTMINELHNHLLNI